MNDKIYPGDTVWLSKEFNVKAIYHGRVGDFFAFIPIGRCYPFLVANNDYCETLGLAKNKFILVNNQFNNDINDFIFEKCSNGFVSEWKVYEDVTPDIEKEVLAFSKSWTNDINPGFRIGFKNKRGQFITSIKISNKQEYLGVRCTNNPEYWTELTNLNNTLP